MTALVPDRLALSVALVLAIEEILSELRRWMLLLPVVTDNSIEVLPRSSHITFERMHPPQFIQGIRYLSIIGILIE